MGRRDAAPPIVAALVERGDAVGDRVYRGRYAASAPRK